MIPYTSKASRKMKRFILFPVLLILMLSWNTSFKPRHKVLFNGRDLRGWHIDVPKMDTVATATSPFIVRDGLLVSLGSPVGHIITDAVYKNYRLQIQYRFPVKAGNSGVLLHVSTPRIIYGVFPRSIEAQLQHLRAGDFNCMGEDISVPEMETRRGPKNQWGTTPDKKYRIDHLVDSERPIGEWNSMVIECLNNSIKIWVNSDLANDGSNCTAQKGQIALQSEGTEVEFRNIILTPITKFSRIVCTNAQSRKGN